MGGVDLDAMHLTFCRIPYKYFFCYLADMAKIIALEGLQRIHTCQKDIGSNIFFIFVIRNGWYIGSFK